ncbi:amino acid permease [Brucella pituitosa]|nr:amino acid permease [Brucella pituitosa]MCK4204812.1 amino acid permease [Brucella pituitosa]
MLGVLAEIAAWIVGPSRGMYVTAQKGILPTAFAKVNKNGVPVALVVAQLLLTSIAIIVLTNTGGSSNMSFLIALALTVVIYLCTYFLMFLGYIQLILRQPELKPTFRVPGSNGVKISVAVIGFLVSVIAFFVSFYPPTSIGGETADKTYVALLIVSFLVVLVIPFVVYALHDKRGKKTNVTLVPIKLHNAPDGHFFMHPRARSPHHIIVD